MGQDIEEAYEVLCGVGLHPSYYKDILSAAKAVAGIVSSLRRDLANPPPDVQEKVLHDYGWGEILERLENAHKEKQALEDEIAELKQALEKNLKCGCARLQCKTCTPMEWTHQKEEYVVSDTDLYIYG
jgi:hypothetical protein